MNDEELVRRVQDGEILAFETLVRKYQARLVNFAQRYTNDRGLAEEAVQDGFFKIYQTIDRIDLKRKFTTYLFAVVKNGAISLGRSQRLVEPLLVDLPDRHDETMMESLAREDDRKRVRRALFQLGERYRTILGLYYFEERSYQEISRLLRLPINTVRTHLRRAKMQLQKGLKRDG